MIDSVAFAQLAAWLSRNDSGRDCRVCEVDQAAKTHADARQLPPGALQSLSHNVSLEQLELEECSVTDNDLALLEHSAKCTTLGLRPCGQN